MQTPLNEVLFVAGSVEDLRRMSTMRTALLQAGMNVRLHWYGATQDWQTLGLPEPDLAVAPQQQAMPEFARALTAKFEEAPPRLCVIGSGTPASQAAAVCATSQAVPLARIDAGRRSQRRVDPADKARRALDHACTLWFVATEHQRLNLVREGLPLTSIHVVGSLMATPPAEAPHAVAGSSPTIIAAWNTTRQDAFATAPSAWSIEDWQGQLTQLATASLVVTDDEGTAEAACAMAVPCVLTRPYSSMPEAVDHGLLQVAGDDPVAIARAIEIRLAAAGDRTSPYAQTSHEALAATIQGWLSAADEGCTQPNSTAENEPLHLPSDGDASGRTLGHEEIEMCARAIASGTLNSTKGTFVSRFEQAFALRSGHAHVIACASGSAAVHCAVNALQLQAGDEVITTPITDMGALTCVLYEGALPVFCDVDATTLNITAETIAAQITPRTRAVIVTHLFGRTCDMASIVALCKKHNLPIIEDNAQAFGATDPTGPAGSFGAISCYSLQQGKHMTTGEGGVVCTDDPELARRMFLFVNKAWGYGDPKPDHYFPALNFRLSELQGAVALAQLDKLDWVVARRRAVAAKITEALADVPGLVLPAAPNGGEHSWWKYAFHVDPHLVEGGAVQLGTRMRERGVFCVPRYIQKPAFECELFQHMERSPVSSLPWSASDRGAAPQPLFRRDDYPGTVRALETIIVLPINELYTQEHIDYVTTVIREEAEVLSHA